MNKFTDPLVVELVGKNLWSVYEPFDYLTSDGKLITVPIGFVTDFATVPRIFWPIISPVDKHGKAAALHDYLYTTQFWPKSKCDLIFKEALNILNVTPWKVFAMYWAVRLFGGWAWYTDGLKRRTN